MYPEFAKRNITTVSATNKFLQEKYIDMFNKRFAVKPAGESIFVSSPEPSILDSILCIKTLRKTDKTGIFSFKGKHFQLYKDGKPFLLPKKEITVMISPRIGICAQYQNFTYSVKRCEPVDVSASASKADLPPAKKKQSDAVAPHLKHGSSQWKSVWWFENYNETLLFLYDLFFAKQQSSS